MQKLADQSQLDSAEIMRILPHRIPLLLVDRVLDYTLDESLTALKLVSANEPQFSGHFPENPVMPGVFMLEALAQAAGVLACLSSDAAGKAGQMFYFGGIDSARFKRIVQPGDVLTLHISVLKKRRNLWKVHGEVRVDDALACSADIMIAAGSDGQQQSQDKF